MGDLISRQALLAEYDRAHKGPPGGARKLIEAAPDALIKCRDCDWWTKQEASLQGRCARYGFYPTGSWYCAGAKKRE